MTLKLKAEMLLPILTLIAQGKTVQWMWRKDHESGSTQWIEMTQNELKYITNVNDPNSFIWRIKPEQCLGYRRYLRESDIGIGVETVWQAAETKETEKQADFKGWIDKEWQYHELLNQKPQPVKPKAKKTVPYKRFIANYNGHHYVALKFPDGHAPCHYLWHGTFVEWIDTEWQTAEVEIKEESKP